jgi:hypothetical protein
MADIGQAACSCQARTLCLCGLTVLTFSSAVSAFLARTHILSLAVSHLHRELRTGQLAWLDQPHTFRGTATALAAVERGRTGRATFSGPLATDDSVRVHGECNAERLTGSSSIGQLTGGKEDQAGFRGNHQ